MENGLTLFTGLLNSLVQEKQNSLNPIITLAQDLLGGHRIEMENEEYYLYATDWPRNRQVKIKIGKKDEKNSINGKTCCFGEIVAEKHFGGNFYPVKVSVYISLDPRKEPNLNITQIR
jgi:hypothetical protein